MMNTLTQKQRSFLEYNKKNKTLFFRKCEYTILMVLLKNGYTEPRKNLLNRGILEYIKCKKTYTNG